MRQKKRRKQKQNNVKEEYRMIGINGMKIGHERMEVKQKNIRNGDTT